MKKITLSALAAAGLLASLATGANAADLGGNCCADLEERVAELEATTARKGNRKVSLTISGWVAEQAVWWDDGVESNTYVGGIGTTLGTNVKFTGQATIAPGWTAGYLIHLEADGSDSLVGTNRTTPNGPGLNAGTTNYVQTLQSYWFVKSETYGKIALGLQSMPSDNAAILVDGSGSLVPANWVTFDVGGFNYTAAGAATGQQIIGGCNGGGDCYGVPVNGVRYDTPTFAGFSASAGWGEDDYWDIAVRYAGEAAGFKLAGTVAYAESTGGRFGGSSEYTQAGLYVQHIATGLFGLVNYGNFDVLGTAVDQETWYFKGGLRQRWSSLGHTVLYGEYDDVQDMANVTGADQQFWGLGVVQEIDNAAMSLWVSYRQFSFEDNTATNFNDFDMIKAGALINF